MTAPDTATGEPPTAAGEVLLYGASGYMGELIAREAARQGFPLTLAGRSESKLAALGAELKLPLPRLSRWTTPPPPRPG